jgi:hypothetical protein
MGTIDSLHRRLEKVEATQGGRTHYLWADPGLGEQAMQMALDDYLDKHPDVTEQSLIVITWKVGETKA